MNFQDVVWRFEECKTHKEYPFSNNKVVNKLIFPSSALLRSSRYADIYVSHDEKIYWPMWKKNFVGITG